VRQPNSAAGRLARLSLVLLFPALALATSGFGRRWHWFQEDIGHSVALANDGGYLVSGETWLGSTQYGIVLARTDSLGDTTWVRHILDTDQYGGYACRLLDGGYAVLGTRNNRTIFVRKFSAAGDSVWTYVSSWNGFVSAVIATDDSGCAIAGRMPDTAADFGFIKLRPDGTEEWARFYEDPMVWATWARNATQTRDGGYIICGDGNDYSNTYLRLVRINSGGDTLWTRLYSGLIGPYPAAVGEMQDGGFLTAGYTFDTLTSLNRLYMMRTNSTGDTLWTRTIEPTGVDAQANAMSATRDGGYIIAGSVDWFDSARVWLVKVDSGGDTVWTRTLGGPGRETGADVEQTADGGYTVAGTSDLSGGSILLIKTDSLGRTGVSEGRPPVSERVAFSVSPNPASGAVRITYSLSRATEARLSMYDALGRQVLSWVWLLSSPYRLDIRSMPAGVYLLRLDTGPDSATRKLVVE
jgi:hypothetical protein